jgi:O-antigen ligase
LSRGDLFALVVGLFLGLGIVKFGNPVILDHKIIPPSSLSEAWAEPWPTHWSRWLTAPLALTGIWLAVSSGRRWPVERRFWVLPTFWFLWQIVSATRTVDNTLTGTTLWHFAACLACYFLGAQVLGYDRALRWMLIGVLAAFAFCLVRAANQRLIEFPHDRQALIEGQHTGWTNFPPDVIQQMKRDGLVVNTNGVDVANPIFLAKLTKGRVHGTLVYPNALAGAVLLLLPLSLVLAVNQTECFRPWIRAAVISLTFFLGCASLVWTGSKSGWLIAMGLCGVWLFRLKWPTPLKWFVLITLVSVGLAVFAVRFGDYFARGATSVGARFDYWRAALRITREHPWFGTGPGTFQRPYASLKTPDAEMARLAHNDYLEQFSDSGIPGGTSYVFWIGSVLVTLGRRLWGLFEPLPFAVFLGLLGWFLQGFSEFGLYIPALAYTGFTLLGWLLGATKKRIESVPAVSVS